MTFKNIENTGKALAGMVANTAETGKTLTNAAKNTAETGKAVTGIAKGATQGVQGFVNTVAMSAYKIGERSRGQAKYSRAIGNKQGYNALKRAETTSAVREQQNLQKITKAKSATEKVKAREALRLEQDEINSRFKKQKLNIRASTNAAKLLNKDLKTKARMREMQKMHEQKEKQENQQEKYEFFINTEFLNILRKLKDKYKGDLKIDPKFWSETNRKRILKIAKDGKTGGWFTNYRKELLQTLKGDTAEDF